MKEMVSHSVTTETPVDDEMAFHQLMEEIRMLNEQMRNDRREIERLKAETEQLTLETNDLKRQTRESLLRLGVTL